MTERAHKELFDIMTDFIIEKGKHWRDDKLCNCWEAGMMKAMVMINEYVKENGYVGED